MRGKLHEPRRHLSGGRGEEGPGELGEAAAALSSVATGVCRPGSQCARQCCELGTRELLKPWDDEATQLCEEVILLKTIGATHLLQQLGGLLRAEGRKPNEHLSPDVLDFLVGLRSEHARDECLELEVRAGAFVLSPRWRKLHPSLWREDLPWSVWHHALLLHGRLEGHCLLGLLHVALKPLEHFLDRIVVLLGLLRLLWTQKSLQGEFLHLLRLRLQTQTRQGWSSAWHCVWRAEARRRSHDSRTSVR
mmetsp:Transcript_57395/g.124177  ORF Transcript_57395/g.124177 Transcript_57395/m.124177 type:complete len:249 (+) Transcript_57395:1079-1825(+)